MKELVFCWERINLEAIERITGEWIFHGQSVVVGCELSVKKNSSEWISNNVPQKWVIEFKKPGAVGRPALFLTEPGLYFTVSKAKTDLGYWLRDKIYEEVLPAIRRDGGYISPAITPPQAIALKAKIDRILDTPSPWERMYDSQACEKAFKWYGTQFYWTYCYSWMSVEERCKLEQVNPVVNGDRSLRIHQCIEPDTKARLTPYVTRLVDFLISSTSKQDFETRMGRVFGTDQMELELR